MSKFTILVATLVVALSPLVLAHGSLMTFKTPSHSYAGPLPGGSSTIDSPVRIIETLGPVQDVQTADMRCGWGSTPEASEVAPVNAGDEIQIRMRSGIPTVVWPHNIGVMMVYMGACTGNCNLNNMQWFKIMQTGLRSDGTWAMQELNNNHTTNFTIPHNLRQGNYLVRHEALALHNSLSRKGAEFYISCTQVAVKSSGTDFPPTNLMVSFPGAYSQTDPGILVPNIYNGLKTYTFPGPAVWGSITANTAPAPSGSKSPPSGTSSTATKSKATTSASIPTGAAGNGTRCPGRNSKRQINSRVMRRHAALLIRSTH